MKFKIDWSNYCGICQGIHEPDVDCNGNPVDWQARQERARQQLRKPLKRGAKWHDSYLESAENEQR